MMNVPIHFHGVSPFLMGRLEKVKEIFANFSSSVELTSWGEVNDLAPVS
jgi:hypothetical protein